MQQINLGGQDQESNGLMITRYCGTVHDYSYRWIEAGVDLILKKLFLLSCVNHVVFVLTMYF